MFYLLTHTHFSAFRKPLSLLNLQLYSNLFSSVFIYFSTYLFSVYIVISHWGLTKCCSVCCIWDHLLHSYISKGTDPQQQWGCQMHTFTLNILDPHLKVSTASYECARTDHHEAYEQLEDDSGRWRCTIHPANPWPRGQQVLPQTELAVFRQLGWNTQHRGVSPCRAAGLWQTVGLYGYCTSHVSGDGCKLYLSHTSNAVRPENWL